MDKRRVKQFPTGVRPHGNGIEIKFIWPKGGKAYAYKTLDWRPTPANLERAGKLRQQVIDEIKHGVFRWANHWPDDPRAAQRRAGTFHHYAQAWLDTPENDWKPQTRYKWLGILERIWMPALHDRPLNLITYTDLSAALAEAYKAYTADRGAEPSKSLYNDWLTCARGVFDTAVRDGAISRLQNPAAEFRNKAREKTEPDPFAQAEMDAIITDIYRHNGDMWGAWFELGFYTGMRYPSEPAALTWHNVDLSRAEIKITQIRSKHAKGGIQTTTKTGVARTVHLNSRALSAIKKAKALTGFGDKWVFMQSIADGAPVITGDPQRAMWRASIKRLKLRPRDPYNMRHSYATFGLMHGANPAFMARQLGHSLEEFFKTYAKWIDRTSDKFQMGLIESGITGNVAETWRNDSGVV